MPRDRNLRPEPRTIWRHRDLVHAVADIGRVLGWQVFAVSALTRDEASPNGSGLSGPQLLLVDSLHRRVVLARLTLRAATGALPALTSPASREQGSGADGSGQPVVETLIWGPADIVDGTVGAHLSGRQDRPRQRAA